MRWRKLERAENEAQKVQVSKDVPVGSEQSTAEGDAKMEGLFFQKLIDMSMMLVKN